MPTTTSTGITTQQQVPGIATVSGPAALLDGDYYYLAWRGSDGASICWASCPSTDNGAELQSYDWTTHPLACQGVNAPAGSRTWDGTVGVGRGGLSLLTW